MLCLKENDLQQREKIVSNYIKYHNYTHFQTDRICEYGFFYLCFTPEAIEAYKKEINHQMSTCLFYVRNKASFGFHFYNFELLPLNNDQIDLSEFRDPKKYKNINFIFFYACQYGYFSIVKILLETEKIDIYETIIFF